MAGTTYLVVNDEADRGVYAFSSKNTAIDIATNFKNYVFMRENEKEKAMELIGVDKVTDAIFLIRKYRSRPHPPRKTQQPQSQQTSFADVFSSISDTQKPCLKITMNSGDEYIVYLNDVFYTREADLHKKFMMPSGNGFSVNTVVVDNAIKAGKIGKLEKSKVECNGDFITIYGCDDRYSPDIEEVNGVTVYKHHYPKAALNVKNVETVLPVDSVELGSYMIKNPALVKHLQKNM